MKNVIISLSESYHVTVKTSNITDAGTNAKVFIKIHGDKGVTRLIELEKKNASFAPGRYLH